MNSMLSFPSVGSHFTVDFLLRAAAGLLFSLVIALFSYRKKSLSFSGVIAAAATGTLLFSFGSLRWYGVMIAFFITSSLLSRWRTGSKSSLEARYEKTGQRDAWQVAANGGLPTLVCILAAFFPSQMWWPLYLGLLASANADTWATEIGTAYRTNTFSILSFRKAESGTSGAISFSGTLAAFAGALFIGLVGWLLEPSLPHSGLDCLFAAVGGFIGSLLDSVFGASIQALYRCRVCGIETEKPVHHGKPCQFIRGFPWMTNDAVNASSSFMGGFTTLILSIFVANPLGS